jgi:nitrite reductase/ring-hydroxylating ferredoxin subunit
MENGSEPRWRADFPIRWEADHYVTRRELAKFLTLGSALLAGANMLLALVGRARKRERFAEQTIARASALAAGTSLQFRYPTDADPCILLRGSDGRLAAYSQVCTHLSCAVTHRAAEGDLFCPCHCGVFAVDDGRPLAGPPSRRLPRITLVERGDEIIATGVER